MWALFMRVFWTYAGKVRPDFLCHEESKRPAHPYSMYAPRPRHDALTNLVPVRVARPAA
jgi:hypothetical protein